MADSNLLFTKFPDLAIELRVLIWKAAIIPRIVTIRKKALHSSLGEDVSEFVYEEEETFLLAQSPPLEDKQLMGITSDNAPPPLLLVCKESHTVAVKYYTTRAFAVDPSFPQTYFDFQRDTLYLRYDTFDMLHNSTLRGSLLPSSASRLTDKGNIKRVENLAVLVDPLAIPGIATNPWELLGGYERWVAKLLRTFCGVQKLTLVIRHFKSVGDGDQSALRFAEPFDLGGALRIFRTYNDVERDGYFAPNKNSSYTLLDKDALEEFLQDVDRQHPTYTMTLPLPSIDYKMCLTENTWEQYQKALSDPKQLPLRTRAWTQ